MLPLPDLAAIQTELSDIRIREEAISFFTQQVTAPDLRLPTWRGPAFPQTDGETTAAFFVVANAVNFCFWGTPKWTVDYRGKKFDGSLGLFAAFTRALEENLPVLDASYLASLEANDLAQILRGNIEIPLFSERLACLHELGQGLLSGFNGSPLNLIASAGNSAEKLVHLLTTQFPGFHDTAVLNKIEIGFHKRAQLVCAMLYGRFRGTRWGALGNLEKFSLFADYKLPQILRELGILQYTSHLAERVDTCEELPAGSSEEVQIRAATVCAGSQILAALKPCFPHATAVHLDALLWTAGQKPNRDRLPYHRTRTIFY